MSYSFLSNSLNNRDERFASYALMEANKSNMVHHQHGCIAVLGGQIIARGYNSDRTQSSDGFLKNTCSCHAEIDVMRKLEKRLSKKSSSFSAKKRRSCFLWKDNPLCRKKKPEQ
jgi:tRNA(Arg) A34 adenosine deaminase TadA